MVVADSQWTLLTVYGKPVLELARKDLKETGIHVLLNYQAEHVGEREKTANFDNGDFEV